MFLFSLIKLMRLKHWIKNAFVIIPLIFTLKFTEINSVYLMLQVFLAFCLMASSVYIFNDIFDKEKDKKHPEKKFRPIANGKISLPTAIFLDVLLFILAYVIAYNINIKTLGIVLLYFFINLLYSIQFKQYVIFDVFFIALGFILRVYAGAFAINVSISHWIILTTFFIALFLGFSKRLNEIKILKNNNSHREVLSFYSKELLVNFLTITATLTIIFYALYTIDPKTISRFGTNNLIYSIPLVVFGIFRYLYLVFQENKGGDVVETVLGDIWIILSCLVWFIYIVCILLFKF
jgi:decaprenyl-phosphate phosphoribosyltransferase